MVQQLVVIMFIIVIVHVCLSILDCQCYCPIEQTPSSSASNSSSSSSTSSSFPLLLLPISLPPLYFFLFLYSANPQDTPVISHECPLAKGSHTSIEEGNRALDRLHQQQDQHHQGLRQQCMNVVRDPDGMGFM